MTTPKDTAKRERDDKRGLNDRSDEYNGQGTCDEALKRMERKAEKGLV